MSLHTCHIDVPEYLCVSVYVACAPGVVELAAAVPARAEPRACPAVQGLSRLDAIATRDGYGIRTLLVIGRMVVNLNSPINLFHQHKSS
jgi:hypothetical protein